jgi:hypothetical protein
MNKIQFIKEMRAAGKYDETFRDYISLRGAMNLANNIIDDPEKWIKMIQSLAAQKEPQYTAVITTDTCWWEAKGTYTKILHAAKTAERILLKYQKEFIFINIHNEKGETVLYFHKEGNYIFHM